MSDIQSTIQGKADLITSIVATAGVPAPIAYFNWGDVLNDTAKITAIIYSIVSATWIIIKIVRSRKP